MEELVTVFRSADENAEEDSTAIAEILEDEGISPTLLDDHAPGVPQGVWEVRVAAADRARAEELIAANLAFEDEFPDPNKLGPLDWATVYKSADGVESEAEALTIQSLLKANGIDAMIAGERIPLPNLGWEIRVVRGQEAEARQIIDEARAAGPSAAEEAEAETEQ